MSNSLTLGKRAFAAAVAAVTILSTVGLAAFAPAAQAMTTAVTGADPGDNIKGSAVSTVYYYGYDGSRYTYPNAKTYMTWFEDFSDVRTVSDAELADVSLAGNVVYRPGSRWIKITSDNKTYAVSRDGMIHWVETEAVATAYDGSDWNTNIDDVADVFFVDYTAGASLMSATAFDGMMYMDGTDYMLAWDGESRMVTSAGRSANDMKMDFFLDGAGINDSALTVGDDITGAVCDLQDAAQTGCVEDITGNLTVSLASSSPASATVPDTATGVEVAKFRLTAGDATELETLAVELTGLTDTNAIDGNGVYLYEGANRLTDGRTVNSSTRKATFAGLNLDFSAGQSRELSVVVDMGNSGETGTFGFQIATNNDVMTTGTVSGSYPVRGATHSIVDLTVGEITIDATGSIPVPTLGEQDAEIAEFNLGAGSAEDVWVKRLTLTIEDAADHADFQLYQGSNWMASGQSIGSDLVVFAFSGNGYYMEDGSDRDFTVTADIGGEADDTIVTYLDNDADLYAVGADYGFGVSVDRTGYDGTAGDLSTVTIEGGEVTVSFNGPASDDVQNGADEVSFFEFTITAERYTEVQELQLTVDGNNLTDGTDTALEDIRVEECGSGMLVTGPEELVAGGGGLVTSQDLTFTDVFTVEAGESLELCVTADINDAVAVEGDEVTFTLVTSALDVEDSSGDAIEDVVPSSDIVGNTMTIQDASLAISLASSPAGNTDYVKGQNGVVTAGFNFTAGTGSNIVVTDLEVGVYVNEDGGGGGFATGNPLIGDSILTCTLNDSADDSVIAGPESIETDANLIFDNFSWDVRAGETETAEVVCNLANLDPGTADIYAFEIGAGTDVQAEDAEGDDVTPTGDANTAQAVTVTVNDSGELTIDAGDDVPDAEYLVTGSVNNLVSTFRVDADAEGYRIDRLTVAELQATADGLDAAAYANNIAKVTIAYPKMDGTEGMSSGALTGNERTFNLTGGNEMYVEKNGSAEIEVWVDVSASDRSGGSATSNERIRMGLSLDGGADDQFRARGGASNETLVDSNVTLGTASDEQEIFRVRETAPTVALSALTPTGQRSPGDFEVLRFTVAANANEAVVMRSVMFKVTASDAAAGTWNECTTGDGDIAATDFNLYDMSNEAVALDDAAEWTLFAADGSTCGNAEVVAYALLTFDTDAEQVTVGAGLTKTFALHFDSTGASVDDSIQFSLAGDLTSVAYTAASDLNEADLQPEDTTLTVTSSAGYSIGDIACLDTADDGCGATDEKLLVVAVPDGTSISVVRGYMGTTPDSTDANDAGDDIDVLPGGFLWQDDGSKAVTDATQEYYGADLVNNLPLTPSNGIAL